MQNFNFGCLIQLSVKYKVRIFLSLHSAPYSSNGLETRDGFFEFSTVAGSVNTMLKAVTWIAKRCLLYFYFLSLAVILPMSCTETIRYSSNPMFAGINLINEPYNSIQQSTMINYYKQSTAIIRKYSKVSSCSFLQLFFKRALQSQVDLLFSFFLLNLGLQLSVCFCFL